MSLTFTFPPFFEIFEFFNIPYYLSIIFIPQPITPIMDLFYDFIWSLKSVFAFCSYFLLYLDHISNLVYSFGLIYFRDVLFFYSLSCIISVYFASTVPLLSVYFPTILYFRWTAPYCFLFCCV